jgi:NAD(P)-dependent dehydrogenase (short-subunit alcohol dehydrogenase family)
LTTEEKYRSKLEGKVAVITGGSSGIGLATAQRFVSDGAYVFITGCLQSELDAEVELIGKNLIGVQSDVSTLADLHRLYSTVKKEKSRVIFGTIVEMLIVNNISNYLLFYNPRPYMYSRFKSYC